MNAFIRNNVLKLVKNNKWTLVLVSRLLSLLSLLKQDSFFLRKQIGQAFLNRKEFHQAIPHLQKAVAINNQSLEAYGCLGACYWSIGDLANAADAYTRAVNLEPQADELQKNLGLICFELQQWANTVEHLKTLFHDYKKDSSVCRALGVSLYHLKQWDQAIEPLELYIAEHNEVDYLLILTQCYESSKQFKQAVQTNLKALDLAPENEDLYYRLACCYALDDDWDNAAQSYEKAMHIYMAKNSMENPKETQPAHIYEGLLFGNLSTILLSLGYVSVSEIAIRKALEIWPRCGQCHAQLGKVMAHKHDYEQAIQCYADADKLGVETEYARVPWELREAYADNLYEKKQFQHAALEYTKALASQVENLSLYQKLQSALELSGQTKALETVSKAMQAIKS